MFLSFLTTTLSFVSLTSAYPHKDAPNLLNRAMHVRNPGPQRATQVPPQNSTFTQLIDHKNESLGTFEQFYYYSSQYWRGPGSPVILFTPGEVAAEGYDSVMTTRVTSGVLAQKLGAAVVVIEHRYWGRSSPYDELSTKNLKYLTLENSVQDFVRFAQKAQLPFAPEGGSNATSAPWIFLGGSYSGALAAWTESTAPGTFWAYWASSAPVNTMDYWQYFVPVQEGMAKNCSADISLVVDYVDHVGLNGTVAEQKSLQTMFGVGELDHYDDFAATLLNGPWLWQGNDFTGNSDFFDFCDTVEGVLRSKTGLNTTLPSASGVGLEKALSGYAYWVRELFLPNFCASFGYPEFEGVNNVACLDSYNPNNPAYTELSVLNVFDRQWSWMTCNEPFGYWQDAPPAGRPSLASRFVNRAYWERQCGLMFPPSPEGDTYGLAAGKTYETVNQYTGGWFIDNSTRLLYVNGEFDPWREASVSSEFRPDGPLQSTEQVPVYVVPGGFHCSDLTTQNGFLNAGCQAVIDKAIATMVKWVAEWPTVQQR